MKSYSYKLINFVFSVAVYNLLSTNFSMPFRQKSLGLVSKNLLSQFLRSSYGSTKSRKDSNLWVQGSENMVDAEKPPIQALGVQL